MTLPASGQISMSTFNVEMEQASNYSSSLDWINQNTKSTQRPATPNMGGYYGKAWYQRNADGNCNNGNCNCSPNCNCFFGSEAINCTNCINCYTVNCTNCDTRKWLQNNCNCVSSYNCNPTIQFNYNCIENCNCGNA